MNDVPPEFTLLKIEGAEVKVPSVETKELPGGLADTAGSDAGFGDRMA